MLSQWFIPTYGRYRRSTLIDRSFAAFTFRRTIAKGIKLNCRLKSINAEIGRLYVFLKRRICIYTR